MELDLGVNAVSRCLGQLVGKCRVAIGWQASRAQIDPKLAHALARISIGQAKRWNAVIIHYFGHTAIEQGRSGQTGMLSRAKLAPEHVPIAPLGSIAQAIAQVVAIELRTVFTGRRGFGVAYHCARRNDHTLPGLARPRAEIDFFPISREKAFIEAAKLLPEVFGETDCRAMNRVDIGKLVVLAAISLATTAMRRQQHLLVEQRANRLNPRIRV